MGIFKYELGARVKDIVTGFTGVVVARSEFLNGCIRYAIQPAKLSEGKPIESEHFDEAQLAPAPGKPVKVTRQPIHQRTGGPREPVRQRRDIPR